MIGTIRIRRDDSHVTREKAVRLTPSVDSSDRYIRGGMTASFIIPAFVRRTTNRHTCIGKASTRVLDNYSRTIWPRIGRASPLGTRDRLTYRWNYSRVVR
jgi:hypothetical protein